MQGVECTLLQHNYEQLGVGLLGVQLDDQVDSDVEVDIRLSGHCNNLTLEGILITIQPLGSSNKSVCFLQTLEECIGNALLTDSDDVTGLNQIAGDVDPDFAITVLAEDPEMTADEVLTLIQADDLSDPDTYRSHAPEALRHTCRKRDPRQSQDR